VRIWVYTVGAVPHHCGTRISHRGARPTGLHPSPAKASIGIARRCCPAPSPSFEVAVWGPTTPPTEAAACEVLACGRHPGLRCSRLCVQYARTAYFRLIPGQELESPSALWRCVASRIDLKCAWQGGVATLLEVRAGERGVHALRSFLTAAAARADGEPAPCAPVWQPPGLCRAATLARHRPNPPGRAARAPRR